MEERAYFVRRPRRLEELCLPHFAEREEPYVIDRRVCLSALDYENFAEDLLVERSFLCGRIETTESAVRHCIFVHRRGYADGILAVASEDGHVLFAAYLPER